MRTLFPIVFGWMWMVPLIRVIGDLRNEQERGLTGVMQSNGGLWKSEIMIGCGLKYIFEVILISLGSSYLLRLNILPDIPLTTLSADFLLLSLLPLPLHLSLSLHPTSLHLILHFLLTLLVNLYPLNLLLPGA